MRRALPFFLAALAACGPVRKGAPEPEFDVYLEHFAAVRTEGADIYLRASSVADELGGGNKDERRKALEARLEALRLIDRYNKVLVGMARGEDPKHLKSGMKAVGSRLSAYRPSAQTTFAFASAVPYVGVLVSGAGYVQEALAKRRFVKAVREAQKPIDAILDLLLLDSEPLETVLVTQVEREQDAPRAAVDSLGSRFYRKLQELKATPELGELLGAHNSLREAASLGPIPYAPKPAAEMPTTADLDHLAVLKDEAEVNLREYRDFQVRIGAEKALFERYREALRAAKAALAALNKESEAERAAATGAFNAQALGVRQEALRLREANK
ncbi:MAG: hypothetical protein HY553_16105 [Elusimicrobia bacterium]|nr:hypothetical protein [Elusimicrobiota bacterium]